MTYKPSEVQINMFLLELSPYFEHVAAIGNLLALIFPTYDILVMTSECKLTAPYGWVLIYSQ